MAKKSQYSPLGMPGAIRTFIAKTAAAVAAVGEVTATFTVKVAKVAVTVKTPGASSTVKIPRATFTV